MSKQRNYRAIKGACLFAALGIWILPAVSVAQQYYDPGLLQKTVDRRPVDYQAPGVRAGSFTLNPGAELAWENNDNIFYMNKNEIRDNIIHIRPWLNANSDWSRHEMNFSAFADIAKYDDYGSQDYTDWVVSLDGRIDVKRGSAFNYKASYLSLHEDRSNPDSRQSVKPTEYDFSGIDLDYTHNFNRVAATLGFTYDDTDFKNGKDLAGNVVDNNDRDRSRDAWLLMLGYNYSEQSTAFVSYEGNNTDYDEKFDRNGFERSSNGYDIRGGVSWNMTGAITGDLYLQYVSQDYDDPRFKNVDGFGIGANLDWTPTKLTSVTLKFANTPQETTQIDTSGYYSSLYSARVQHELRRNVLLNARLSYTDNNYKYDGQSENALQDTDVTRAGIGFSWLMSRNFNLSGGYVFETQNANDDYFEYSTNRWFITLGGEL